MKKWIFLILAVLAFFTSGFVSLSKAQEDENTIRIVKAFTLEEEMRRLSPVLPAVAALGVPTLDGLGAVGDGAHSAKEYVVTRTMPSRAALLAALLAAS